MSPPLIEKLALHTKIVHFNNLPMCKYSTDVHFHYQKVVINNPEPSSSL
jgi:hypothetical protein